jgi:HTH-type transcriptional regulator/antitoxin HipB
MSNIAQVLQQARKAKKISQSDMSRLLNLPQSHISKIESGKTDLRLSNLENIAHALGFELMLIPKAMAAYVQATIEGRNVHQIARWLPDEESDE